ncbi:MAG: MATE family efflux transporter [Clostridia bacterium]|nr:MATE family efflux transporter [Clostridia bacterium]
MRATDMTQGRPARLIMAFALPMMAGNICQQLYTIVDAAFVGRFAGIDALAAVGAADWLCWLFLGVVMGCTQGFSVLISQRFGAQDENGVRRAAAQSVVLTALISLGVILLSQSLMVPILRALGTPEDIFIQAVLYLRIIMCGVPIYAAYNEMAAMLRAVGDSKTPLYAMLIASGVNIALDGLFVIVFRWGVAGAASATLIAQGSAALYCLNLVRRMPALRFGKEDLKWDGALARRLIYLGSPTAAQNVIIGLGGMAVQRVINSYGSIFIAGFTATNKLYGIMEMAAVSYGGAIAAYVGQNYGAGQKERLKNGVRSGVIMALITSCAIALALFLLGRPVLSLFVDPEAAQREEVLSVALRYLHFMLAGLFILYLLYVYRSALQGMGDTVTPMLSGGAEMVMRVGVALLLPLLLGQDGIFFAEPAAWAGAEVLLMVTYYRTIRKLSFPETQKAG